VFVNFGIVMMPFYWAVGMKQYGESGSVDATNLSIGEVFFFSQRLWIREWW